MGIGAGDDAELERVDAEVFLVADAVDQGLTHVAVVDPADHRRIGADQVVVLLFETGELVIGRQGRVGIRLTLGLDDLGRQLILGPQLGVARVDGRAGGVSGRIHEAVTQVAVVRDRKGVQAGVALRLQIGPQVLGAVGIKGRERGCRSFVAAEEDVAVQILVDRDRGPLERDQGGELSGLVMIVRHLDVFPPARFEDLGVVEYRVGVIGGQADGDLGEGLVALLGVAGRDQLDDLVVLVLGHQLGLRVGELRQDAEVLGVVGHRTPVVGGLFLHHLAGGVLLDRLALTEVVGVVGCVTRTHGIGIRGVLRVQMLLTEVHIVQRVFLARRAAGFTNRVGCQGPTSHQCRTDERNGKCRCFIPHGFIPHGFIPH